MHSTVVACLFFSCLTLAAPNPNPIPQAIDFALIDSVPEPTALGPDPEADKTVEIITYDRISAAAAASSMILATALPAVNVKRVVDSDDVLTCETPSIVTDAEMEYYSGAAKGASPPAGFSESFEDLRGSIEQIGYLGLRTLDDYEPGHCAGYCRPEDGCIAFNIYFERNPCADIPSTVKCTLYGFPLAADGATYKGQKGVTIAGSNGYNRNPVKSPPIQNFKGPTDLQCAINAPLDPVTGKNTFVGSAAFKTIFDPAQCAAACDTHNAYHSSRPNPKDGTYPPCNFFNSYVLYKNNVPESLVCSMYTRSWDSSYAVNCGQWRGQDRFTIGQSASYTLDKLLPGGCQSPQFWDGKACADAPKDSNPSCARATCSTFKPGCSSGNSDCICVNSPEGFGYCIPGSTRCSSSPTCKVTSDCRSGHVCATDTCCGKPICAPVGPAVCPNPTGKLARRARELSLRGLEEGEDTIAGAWDEQIGDVVPHLMAEN